jgi:hypothetical protein
LRGDPHQCSHFAAFNVLIVVVVHRAHSTGAHQSDPYHVIASKGLICRVLQAVRLHYDIVSPRFRR